MSIQPAPAIGLSGWQGLSLALIAACVAVLAGGRGSARPAPAPDLHRWENEGGMVATSIPATRNDPGVPD